MRPCATGEPLTESATGGVGQYRQEMHVCVAFSKIAIQCKSVVLYKQCWYTWHGCSLDWVNPWGVSP